MTGNIGLFTYSLASASFLLLAALLLAQWRVRPLGPGLLFAAGATGAWAGIVAAGTLYPYPPITLIQLAELARDASWMFFLLQLLGFQSGGDVWTWLGRRWLPGFAAAVLLSLLVIAIRPFAGNLGLSGAEVADFTLALWLAIAVGGLLLVEQVYRNASSSERWGIKFLCLGLGVAFAYDFFMYAEALLFRQLDSQLWQARGIVNTLIVPWLALAIARNRNWRMNVYVSRHVVFHTVTLMGAGLYLLFMAVIGYFIKFLGGSWGGVLQIGFLALAGVLLVTLLFSGNLRARLRVYLSKHFFSYRYDYRDEWLRFTDGLASLNATNAGEGIIRAMAEVALAKSGALLNRDTSGNLTARAQWNREPVTAADLGNVPEWIVKSGWIIDLEEWHRSPDLYTDLELPAWLREQNSLWLVVPLLFQSELEGLVFLSKTDLKSGINWEDRDLLKTAGRQAAALLAQQRASQGLVEARQFDAFNRLSAYVIHDLKNILAQQSLMISNAQKHRHNPAFVDDMIATVENSVKRMQRLMEQMRSGMRSAEPAVIDLGKLLEKVISTTGDRQPQPALHCSGQARVLADRERLLTVFNHLVQNAQEATQVDENVTLSLNVENSNACITVNDTGSGMSESFVRDKLFKPFESTKGLTGMGIGAFESREYVRQLGGDITVRSELGVGSTFTVTLPLAGDDAGERSDVSGCEPDTPATTPGVAN